MIGHAVALALDRAVRGRNVARAIIYLPVLVSPVVMGTMYYLFFSYNYGGLNDIVVAGGADYFFTQKISWTDANVFPHHSFLWEGIGRV